MKKKPIEQEFERHAPHGFSASEQLPENSEEAGEWQDANRSFWESSPMRYDWNEEIGKEEGSGQFFEEIDGRFFQATKATMPWRDTPYDNLIPFEELIKVRF